MTGRIYVGNLPIDIRESELDDLFYKYGRIREIDLKTPARPPAFAFISFDDSRDAQDAIRGRDGYNFDGYRLRVEFSKGRGGGRDEPAARRGGGRRSDYGVVVSNLPRGCSWQDLKDFMRKIGDVVFSDVERNGEGVVEFSNRDDMERAIRTLDDSEFKSYTDSSYIRVRAAGGSKRDRSRSDDRDVKRDSRGRGSGRDRSVSRSRSRSRSHSRSRSPSRDRSRSRSRSLSRERKPRAHSEDEGNGAVKEEEPVRMNSEEDVQEPVRKNSEEDVQEQEPEKKEEVVEQE